MNLQITARQLSSLPSNGWAACIRRNHPQVILFHGQRVEACAAFFAEAVWNKPFDAEGMNNATLFFGTGGCYKKEGSFSKPVQMHPLHCSVCIVGTGFSFPTPSFI